MKQKKYFRVYNDDNGVYFKTKDGLMMRFAGKPHFLLEEYISRYGNKLGIKLYTELHEMLDNIGKKGFSPFVLYSNNQANDKEGK